MKNHPENLDVYKNDKLRYDNINVMCISILVLIAVLGAMFTLRSTNVDLVLFICFVITSPFWFILAFNSVSMERYRPLTLKDFSNEWKRLHYVASRDPVVADMLASWKSSEVGLIYGDVSVLDKYIQDVYDADTAKIDVKN